MKFTLEIEMDESDGSLVAEYGIDSILVDYLDQVREKVYLGHADAGIVWDVNGNQVGKWRTTEGEK